VSRSALLLLLIAQLLVEQHACFFAVVDGMGSVIRRGRSRHAMSALVCGLDVHKDSTYATILDSEGKIVDQTRMEIRRWLLTCLSYVRLLKSFQENRTAKLTFQPERAQLISTI